MGLLLKKDNTMIPSILKYLIGGIGAAFIFAAMAWTELGFPHLAALGFVVGMITGYISIKIKDTWK